MPFQHMLGIMCLQETILHRFENVGGPGPTECRVKDHMSPMDAVKAVQLVVNATDLCDRRVVKCVWIIFSTCKYLAITCKDKNIRDVMPVSPPTVKHVLNDCIGRLFQS